MKTKIITLLFMLTIGIATISADRIDKIGDLYYKLNSVDMTAEVIYQTQSEQNYAGLTTIDIPASIVCESGTYTVTSIGYRAFYKCSSLTSVTIPNSVRSIESYAFCFCSSMTAITIPNSVTRIEEGAFDECTGLTSAVIPNSIVSIENHVFSGCTGLTSVTIPNSVTSIEGSAFNKVNNIIYSGSATGSPWGAKSINGYIDGYLVYSDDTKTTLLGCSSVKTGEIIISDSVMNIGEYAFYNCTSLTSATIPNSVVSIGKYAFENCTSLTSITIPENVTRIETYTFSGCNRITSVAWNAKDCNGYNFGSQVKLFTFCEGVERIPANLCSGMSKLTSIIIPNSVLTIGNSAFEGCRGLTSIYIPHNVKNIWNNTFKDCTGLTSVVIGNGVTSIGSSAFEGCSYLEEIYFGSSLSTIQEKAFNNCKRVASMTCLAKTTPDVKTDALTSINSAAELYVMQSSVQKYKVDDNWNRFLIKEISAEGTQTNDLHVVPNDNSANVVWPIVSGAATYELVIKDKDGNVICTLVFNSNGQLTSIAFAPGRNATQQTQSAGFAFTVTGLTSGTGYDLTMTSKDSGGATLQTKTVSFTTTGDAPQGIDQITNDQSQVTNKILRDGQVLILRGDHTYTLTGTEVR